jgi:hypothetical protein
VLVSEASQLVPSGLSLKQPFWFISRYLSIAVCHADPTNVCCPAAMRCAKSGSGPYTSVGAKE